MPSSQRGIDTRLQNSWTYSIEKENKLRLNWFRRNEKRLNEIANKAPTRAVGDDIKEQLKNELVDSYQNVIRMPRIKTEDPVPIDPRAMQCIMKPVDPATKRLIYTGANKDGRLNYLHERVKLLPNDRYYFPELSSFEYGWNMWDYAKNMKKLGFGRQQVIKDSFYRRRGVERDPDWYKNPAEFSPTICSTK